MSDQENVAEQAEVINYPVEVFQHPVTEVLISQWANMYAECREQYQTAVHLNERLEQRATSLFHQVVEVHQELSEAHREIEVSERMTLDLSRLVLKMLRENPTLVERYRDDYHAAITGPEIIDLTADEEMDQDL